LDHAGHRVTVIEQMPERAQKAGELTEVLVFEGDGSDIRVLEAADVRRVDWLLAVTGRDESNLVACQLARTLNPKVRVLARLNNPANRATFDALDIPVVAVTDMMVQVITREVQVDVADLVRLALLGRGQIGLMEIEIPRGMKERKVADLDLPRPAILVTVVRGDEVFVPEADTVLRPRDRVLAVTAVKNEPALREALCTLDR
jgi:trk system potassium uptake protein TrkA